MSSSRLDYGHLTYHINRGWYEQQGRSLEQVLAARMCGKHRGDQPAVSARRRAVPDPATGELRFLTESATGDDPIETIARCCATQADFITPMMPLMEAIFRVFLAKNNAPLTADEVHDELRAWFASSPRSRYFTVETIARLLENDQHYGIRPASTAES
jgi:hypothetical protein